MSTYEITIPANQEIVKNWSGRYVQIFASSASFEIGLEGQSNWELAEQGLAFGPWEFSRVGFKNSSNDPITATVSVTKYPVVDSRLNIVGALDATVSNFPADQQVNDPVLIALLDEKQSIRLGSSVYNGNANGAVLTALDAASNLNGVVIRSISGFGDYPNGSHPATIIVGPTAPSLYNDVNATKIFSFTSETAGHLDKNIILPAGYGIWHAARVGVSNYATITYDLF